MKTIVNILDEADGDSLVLFDELGAGTDPVEGAALAIAVIEHVRARGAKVLLVTHDADSPATGLADVVLLCGGHEGPLQAGSIAAKMALLFVVDLLVNEYCRRNKQATMHNKDLTTTALACRHL